MSTTYDEPLYYVSTAFSGVAFADPTKGILAVEQDDAALLDPEQVDPDIRKQGRGWLAEQITKGVITVPTLDAAYGMNLDLVERNLLRRVEGGLPLPLTTDGFALRNVFLRLRDAEARLAEAGLS